MLETTKTFEFICPNCKKALNARTGDGVPLVGDITICIHCCCLMIFNEDLSTHPATEIEIDDLDETAVRQLALTVKAIQHVRRVN